MPVLIVVAIIALAAVGIAIWYDGQGNNEKASYDLALIEDDKVSESLFSEYKIFKGDDYVWEFADDATITETIDLTIAESKLTSDYFHPPRLLDVADQCLYLAFDHDSDLPNGTMLRYYVGSEYAGDLRAFFEDGDDTDPLYLTVDDDGFITIEMKHCSNWIVVPACKMVIDSDITRSGDESIRYYIYGTSVQLTSDVKIYDAETLELESSNGGSYSLSDGLYSIELIKSVVIDIEIDLFHNVIYDGNGGSNVPIDSTEYWPNETVNIKFSPIPDKDYCGFLGWSEIKDAEVPTYTYYGKKTLSIYEDDVILYAVWEIQAEDVDPVLIIEKDGTVYNYDLTYISASEADTIKTGTMKTTISGADDTGYYRTTKFTIDGITITDEEYVNYTYGMGIDLIDREVTESTFYYNGKTIKCSVISGTEDVYGTMYHIKLIVGHDGIVYERVVSSNELSLKGTLINWTE